MLRLVRVDETLETEPESYPFPTELAKQVRPLTNEELAERLLGGIGHTHDDVLASLEQMSCRIDELAREFTDGGDHDDLGNDDDRPRAA